MARKTFTVKARLEAEDRASGTIAKVEAASGSSACLARGLYSVMARDAAA